MFKPPIQRGLVAGLAVLLCTSITWAQTRTAVIYLTDRQDPIKGELVDETAEAYVLRIAGIDTPIPKNRVERMEFEKSLADQFKAKRAEIKDDDYDARYDLAKWAFDQESLAGYQLAKKELAALTQAKPDHQQARLLATLVDERIAALKAIEEAPNADQTDPADPQPTADPVTAKKPKTLDENQRALLKVYEVNLANKPRLVIPRQTIDKLLKDYRGNAALNDFTDRQGMARFRNLEGHEQLAIMFEAQARALYDQVQMRDEPESLQTFRTKVNPSYVVRYFMRHFGAAPVEGVNLIDARPNVEENAYTNFLMLHRAKKDGLPFIDRDRPDQSLLLQWGLPRDDATYPAPEVRNWRPYFTGPDDQRFKDMLQWIGSLYRPAPQYPIEYTPPSPEKEDAEDDQAE